MIPLWLLIHSKLYILLLILLTNMLNQISHDLKLISIISNNIVFIVVWSRNFSLAYSEYTFSLSLHGFGFLWGAFRILKLILNSMKLGRQPLLQQFLPTTLVEVAELNGWFLKMTKTGQRRPFIQIFFVRDLQTHLLQFTQFIEPLQLHFLILWGLWRSNFLTYKFVILYSLLYQFIVVLFCLLTRFWFSIWQLICFMIALE